VRNHKLLKSFRNISCVLCGQPSEACHIQSVGAGGEDTEDNLIAFCRMHHQYQHRVGWDRMIANYPILETFLKEKGWQMQDLFGRKRLVKK